MGWVNPWVGLGWIQLKIDVFYSYITGLFITYLAQYIYLDVHVSWIDRQFPKHHAARSGCQTLWAPRLILEIIAQAVNSILAEYGQEYGLGWVTPVQKNHGLGWVGPFAVGLG